MAWPAIAAAVGVAGLVAQYVGSKKAGKAAKEQSEEEARLEGLVTQEKMRQLGIDERVMYGQTMAGYASGGVQSFAPTLGGEPRVQAGSPSQIISEQQKEFAAERQITQDVGASKVKQSLDRGTALKNQYKWSGYANVASGISGILGRYSAMSG